MGRTSKTPEGFYSAAEAIKRLGIPRSTFYTLNIERVVAPHRKDGYYRKEVIDDMVRAKELFIIQYATKPATFLPATIEDVPGIYDVAMSLWGNMGTPSIETRLAWYQSNPNIDYVVKQDGIVVGYVSLMPLKQKTIDQLMTGEKRTWEITAEELLPFIPDIPLACFVAALGVRASVQKPEKYGMRLLAGSVHVLGELGKRGIIFEKLYATSNSPDGVKACRDLGFEELAPIPATTRIRFVMDVATSSSVLLQEYNQARRNRRHDH